MADISDASDSSWLAKIYKAPVTVASIEEIAQRTAIWVPFSLSVEFLTERFGKIAGTTASALDVVIESEEALAECLKRGYIIDPLVWRSATSHILGDEQQDIDNLVAATTRYLLMNGLQLKDPPNMGNAEGLGL